MPQGGVIRKEFGAAFILSRPMLPIQHMVVMIILTLTVPCIAPTMVIFKGTGLTGGSADLVYYFYDHFFGWRRNHPPAGVLQCLRGASDAGVVQVGSSIFGRGSGPDQVAPAPGGRLTTSCPFPPAELTQSHSLSPGKFLFTGLNINQIVKI